MSSAQAESKNFKVFVTCVVDERAIDILESNSCAVSIWTDEKNVICRDRLMQEISDCDGLFCMLTDKVDSKLLDCAINLKVVGTCSVGYDHIDVRECNQRGIKLGYTPDVLTETTAETTVALLLCA